MDARLAVAIIGVLLGLYYFVRGQRTKREELGPVPVVTDDELQILREIEKNGGARREMHPIRPALRRAGDINSIWFGVAPVDYDQCPWIYDLMEKDLKHKGLIESKQARYLLLPVGERVLKANRRRKLKNPRPIIDAKTGEPRKGA